MVLAIIASAMFCFVINSSWKAIPDGALYLELGESIARGDGYVFNGARHTYVPPGYPSVVAAAVLTLGKNFLAYRILMAVLGLLTAVAAYLLILRRWGQDTAFFVGGLFAVNHVLLYNSTFTSSDVPFALTVFLALNAVITSPQKHIWLWSMVVGILAGIPALMRVNGWGVPPALAFFLFCESRDRSIWTRVGTVALFVLSAAVPAISWEVHKSSFPASFHEGTYLNAVIGRTFWIQAEVIGKATRDYMHEITFALSSLSLKTNVLELIVPALVLIGIVAATKNKERLLMPLTVVQLGGLVLSPAGSRYIIALIPGLYLFMALGMLRVGGWTRERFSNCNEAFLRPKLLVSTLFVLLLSLNGGHNLVTIFQARTASESQGAESLRDLPFFTASRWLREHAGRSVVLTMHPRVIHYLSGVPTVELVRSGVPEQEVWIDAVADLKALIAQRAPEYFFSDSSQARLSRQVIEALGALDLRLEDVDQTASSNRFRLWRIIKKEGRDC